MIQRNKFEMEAHNEEVCFKRLKAYKHRPAFSNNWPDGVRD